jgi:DNA-binding MarR family transcriptional regulator
MMRTLSAHPGDLADSGCCSLVTRQRMGWMRIMSSSGRREPVATQTEALLTAARVFAAVTAESIAQAGSGITLPQLRVLVLAAERQPLNATGVAEALNVHLSSASRVCDRLVQAGLLDRRDRPEDRRHVELSLTDAGRDLLDSVTDHRRDIFQRILLRMDPADRSGLAAALPAFVDAAHDYGAGSLPAP